MKQRFLILFFMGLGLIAFSQQDQKPSPRAASSKQAPSSRGNNANGVVSSRQAASGNQARPTRTTATSEAPSPRKKAEK